MKQLTGSKIFVTCYKVYYILAKCSANIHHPRWVFLWFPTRRLSGSPVCKIRSCQQPPAWQLWASNPRSFQVGDPHCLEGCGKRFSSLCPTRSNESTGSKVSSSGERERVHRLTNVATKNSQTKAEPVSLKIKSGCSIYKQDLIN